MGDIAKTVSMRAEVMDLDEYVRLLREIGWNGLPFTFTAHPEREDIEGDFLGLYSGGYRGNSVVFACLLKRFSIFSQTTFLFQQMRGGIPGALFGTPDLRVLENPEPGLTTADMLRQACVDADLSGDWFGAYRPGPTIKRLRPDWVSIILGSPNNMANPAYDPDCEVLGYSFFPGGPETPQGDVFSFVREEVAHYAPIPDPLTKYRGMPLPTAALRDIRGDSAATSHKLKFFENAATPNLVVKFPPGMARPKAQEAMELFEQEHRGAYNAYRTIYLLGGADVTTVGKDLKELDFSATQGKGETRIVAAMGLHPALVPVSEGLQGAALNAGNLGQVRRTVADSTFRPNWGAFAASLQTLVQPVPGTRLWYDERHIPFLAEDLKDRAEIMKAEAETMNVLVTAGFAKESIVQAILADGDWGQLVDTGLVSVQLQPAGTVAPNVAALAEFWPLSSDLPSPRVLRGQTFPADHELVRRYPSLFGPADERKAA
jgi:hypothetical protein